MVRCRRSWSLAAGKKLKAVFDKKKNVQVIFNTKATAADAEKHGCDVVFMCTGMAPRTDFMKGGDLAAALDDKARMAQISD